MLTIFDAIAKEEEEEQEQQGGFGRQANKKVKKYPTRWWLLTEPC